MLNHTNKLNLFKNGNLEFMSIHPNNTGEGETPYFICGNLLIHNHFSIKNKIRT